MSHLKTRDGHLLKSAGGHLVNACASSTGGGTGTANPVAELGVLLFEDIGATSHTLVLPAIPAGATSMELSVAVASGAFGAPLAVQGGATLARSGLTPSTIYDYRLRAFDGSNHEQVLLVGIETLAAEDSNGGGGGEPPPDPFVCSPTVTFTLPAASATLRSLARVRVSVTDPNEDLNPCSKNFNRPCNHESDGPGLLLWLGAYELAPTWKRLNGTPLNGVYECIVDTRDFANSAHDLRVSSRGVGCCRAEATRAVSLQNSLFDQVFYRDIRALVAGGLVVPVVSLGVEVRALEENTARRYWVQHAVRSGTSLDGPYKHEDWLKHQPVAFTGGASYGAAGARFARRNFRAMVTLRVPLSNVVTMREKWTPQFYLSAFDTGTEAVTKIREIEPGKHLVFGVNPARALVYDGHTLGAVFEGQDNDAADASDVARLADKLFVVRPVSQANPRGELFAFDLDAGQVALVYTVRGEMRAPRFVERVGARVIALYVDEAQVKATRAYDLTFGQPKLLWELTGAVTFAGVDEKKLLVGVGTALYISDDGGAPALDHTFPATIRAASADFVGLENGQVWKRTSSGWGEDAALLRGGSVDGVATWSGGTTGEALQDLPARGVCGGQGDWLSGEHSTGTWFDERELRLPLDLVTQTVEGVSALDLFALDLPPLKGDGDAQAVPQRDERLLIGTAASGLFFVYQRSALSEAQGAIGTSHSTAQRVFPFPKAAPVEVVA